MKPRLTVVAIVSLTVSLLLVAGAFANPWNGKVVLQAFWWDCLNRSYQTDANGTGGWYSYLAKLAPRLRDMGFDGIWVPPPCKGANATGGMGYDLYDHYDLGNKFQKGSTGTRFGDQDAFLRMIAVVHANGLEVYPDMVLNHLSGGAPDPNAWGKIKEKSFQYAGFAGSNRGRWVKSWLDFHPNPHHSAANDDWRKVEFGPDICYRAPCCDWDCESGGHYMRDNAREWFIWFRKQTDVDGFRFDAVKHFPPDVVEDLLFNAMDKGKGEAQQRRYFAVGEFVVGAAEKGRLDDWASQTKNRCGTFDFALRDALLQMVQSGGFFDTGSLPNFQQLNRFKTVPFVNNHDSWRGRFSDSSGNGKADHTGNPKNSDEILATIDPDDPRADVAYAVAMAVDGSPMVYYEDLFDNDDSDKREQADPATYATRSYVENLVWCHQKLDFKDGAYKVRFQGSPDLLVIERAGKAVIGINDNGNQQQTATIDTDFGPNVTLHDYSGSTAVNLQTDGQGRLTVAVPPMSYCVWGPVGIGGGFLGHPRRTTQEFQLADDLGDSNPSSLRYGGDVVASEFRTGGSVWLAANTLTKLWVYADAERGVDLRIRKPRFDGAKADDQGEYTKSGLASPETPLYLEFTADREGYHQLAAKLSAAGDPMRVYLKVEYEAPAASTKF
jgi:alpha-amylase